MRKLLHVALALCACSATLPHPTAADATRARAAYPDATLAELQRGRELYVQRCDGCHTLKIPSEVAPERWRHEVMEMRGKGVVLRDDETELIVRYLETLSRRDPG